MKALLVFYFPQEIELLPNLKSVLNLKLYHTLELTFSVAEQLNLLNRLTFK